MAIFIAYSFNICLKVSENCSLCCVISLFYLIFLSKSLSKTVKLRKKKGGANWRGAQNGKNTVMIYLGPLHKYKKKKKDLSQAGVCNQTRNLVGKTIGFLWGFFSLP